MSIQIKATLKQVAAKGTGTVIQLEASPTQADLVKLLPIVGDEVVAYVKPIQAELPNVVDYNGEIVSGFSEAE